MYKRQDQGVSLLCYKIKYLLIHAKPLLFFDILTEISEEKCLEESQRAFLQLFLSLAPL